MKSKILNILSVLFGLLLINGGLDKFLHYMPVPQNLPEAVMKDHSAMLEISWLLPLIGLAEITGGILMIVSKFRALAVLILFPVMVGVLLTHVLVAPEGLPIAIVIWFILGWNIYENKSKYLQLIK